MPNSCGLCRVKQTIIKDIEWNVLETIKIARLGWQRGESDSNKMAMTTEYPTTLIYGFLRLKSPRMVTNLQHGSPPVRDWLRCSLLQAYHSLHIQSFKKSVSREEASQLMRKTLKHLFYRWPLCENRMSFEQGWEATWGWMWMIRIGEYLQNVCVGAETFGNHETPMTTIKSSQKAKSSESCNGWWNRRHAKWQLETLT